MKNCWFLGLKFLYIFRTSLNTIPRRILGLLHCGPHFARHIASVERNFLGRPSISSLVLIPRLRVCSRGRPERNAGCPKVVCYSCQITSPIPFEFDYHFHDISYFVLFAPSYWTVLWSRHVMFRMILSRTLCKVRSLKVCCFARLQVSHA